MSAALIERFGESNAAEIEEAIGPIIADDAFSKATCLLARIFDRLRLTPKGEAMIHILGLPYTDGSMHAAARAIGCSPQAIDYHINAIAPYMVNIGTTQGVQHRLKKKKSSTNLTRPQVCSLLSISDVTLARLERKVLRSEGYNGSSTYKRKDCEQLRQIKLKRNCTWADIANGKCCT